MSTDRWAGDKGPARGGYDGPGAAALRVCARQAAAGALLAGVSEGTIHAHVRRAVFAEARKRGVGPAPTRRVGACRTRKGKRYPGLEVRDTERENDLSELAMHEVLDVLEADRVRQLTAGFVGK